MDALEKTLAEQLQITKWEIEKRKELLSITDDDIKLLLDNKSLFSKYIDGIVKNFYDRQTAVTEISMLIGDAETLRRLKNAMKGYILELFDGIYDELYVNRRLRIGKVHQRIGVTSKLYIAAIHMLRTVLFETIDMTYIAKDEHIYANKLKDSINKLLMFDIQLVFDTYISSLVNEVQVTKDEVSHYAENLEKEVALRTKQYEKMSLKDELTGLNNQRALYEHLRRELSGAEREKQYLSLCYMDLNGFKLVNDTEGHKAGDAILKLVGHAMLASTREIDICCRYGGDEFCIILPRTDLTEAILVIERMVEKFKQLESKKVSFSLGLFTTGSEEFVDIDGLINQADRFMYKAKAMSKKKAGFYIATDEKSVRKIWF